MNEYWQWSRPPPLLSPPDVASLLHVVSRPVGHVLDLVYPHDPVLRGVGLLHHLQLEVLVADLGVAHAVVAGGLP